jgi:SpoVK/Ycf46/Vps4 family AAA+-type ATPase
MNRTSAWQVLLPQVAEAGLAGDRQRLELLVLEAIRTLKGSAPDVGRQLTEILAAFATNPGSLRWKDSGPPPADGDEGLALVSVTKDDKAPQPVLAEEVNQRVLQFVKERRASTNLLAEGISPPSSLLLTGSPGTGKSMLARWLAAELGLPFVVQDLATSISSLLGKTGFNLRRTLDYARNRPTLLLLDEFDAIAKRRDDVTEVGELKRIVNVLLKELEVWPMHSVLVAATNHPALLDAAIRRRFHVVLDLPLPGREERQNILSRAAGRFANECSPKFLMACGSALDGWSGSDLSNAMQAAVRRHLVNGVEIEQSLVEEIVQVLSGNLNGKSVGTLIRGLRAGSDAGLTVRELARLFGKSVSTIQHHLKQELVDG